MSRPGIALLVFVPLACACGHGPAASHVTVTTIAGNGTAGWVDGTGGPNGTTEFNHPYGVAVDGSGDVYVADSYSLRRIDLQGGTTTIAGSGTAGFADGTGGPGGSARFNLPAGVALDGKGSAFVGDASNNCIRKIDLATGQTTTLAGNPAPGFADGSGGLSGSARFSIPTDLVLAPDGSLIVADSFNSAVRRVGPDGTTTTIAGNGLWGYVDGRGGMFGPAEFHLIGGVALGPEDNAIYVADSSNNRIRRIDPSGNTTTLAGNGVVGAANGPAASATFNDPIGVVVAGTTVYVGDGLSNLIRTVSATTGETSTLAGTGVAGFADGDASSAELNGPSGLALDAAGNLYVADQLNNRIRKLTFH